MISGHLLYLSCVQFYISARRLIFRNDRVALSFIALTKMHFFSLSNDKILLLYTKISEVACGKS